MNLFGVVLGVMLGTILINILLIIKLAKTIIELSEDLD